MKIYRTLVLYGKNKKMINVSCVTEDALEQYKQRCINAIRSWGWQKEISFRSYICGESAEDEVNPGLGLVYTKNGFDWWYPIKQYRGEKGE